MRKATQLAMTTPAIALMLATSASAKIPGEVEVTGPGGVDLRLVGDDAFEFPELAGFLGVRTEIAEPRGELGPRYTLHYVAYQPPREVVQHLYPFAEEGPMLYTPHGQNWATGPNGEAPSGWARAEYALMELLASYGFPTPAPAPAPQPGPVTAPGPATAPILWALLVLGGLLGIAAAAELRLWRGRLARPS